MKGRKFKRFSKEEERELLYKFKKENDKYALNKLMKDNRWLVLWLASSIKERKIAKNELDDLIQEGDIALFKAIQGFELEKYKNRISTYAYSKIKQAIFREIKEREIHIPDHIQEDYSNIYKTKNSLEEKFGEKVSVQEISDKTGMPLEKIKFIYEKMNIHCSSLDAPIKYKKSETGDGSKKKSEVIGDISFSSVEQLLILKEELGKIMKIVLNTINQFSEKNKNIFCKRLGLNEDFQDKSIEEIAQEFFCTTSNIRQHIERSFNNLYTKLKKNGHEIQKDRIEVWLSDKIYLCCWLQETTGTNFSILK